MVKNVDHNIDISPHKVVLADVLEKEVLIYTSNILWAKLV